MSEQNHANPQSERNKVLEIIGKIANKSAEGDYIYRGEPEHHKKVSSTLYRQLKKARVENPGDMVEIVQSIEVEAARDFSDKTDEFEILTELQHFGGKTNLLDFTTDPCIALFFACYGPDSLEKDGRVILQDRNGTVKDWIKEPRNPDPNSREYVQKSIFVRSPNGLVNPDKEVVIPKCLKRPILTFLEKECGISPEFVYHDIHGFITSQEIRWRVWKKYARGDTWQQKGDETDNPEEKREYYQKAADCFTEVIKRQPDNSGAYHNRGIVHFSNGETDLAIDDYTQAITVRPDFANAYYTRGLAYEIQDEFEAAIEDYSAAIILKPEFAEAYKHRGTVYCQKAEIDEALNDFNKAIELNPNDAEVHYDRGLAYLINEEFEKAFSDFNKAIELDSNDGKAYHRRGLAYFNSGEFEKAIADFDKALELDPDNVAGRQDRELALQNLQEQTQS